MPLSEEVARDLVVIFLRTLHFLHSNGIVHRDLKVTSLRGTSKLSFYRVDFFFFPCSISCLHFAILVTFIRFGDQPENLLLADKDNDTNIKLADFGYIPLCILQQVVDSDRVPFTLFSDPLFSSSYFLLLLLLLIAACPQVRQAHIATAGHGVRHS